RVADRGCGRRELDDPLHRDRLRHLDDGHDVSAHRCGPGDLLHRRHSVLLEHACGRSFLHGPSLRRICRARAHVPHPAPRRNAQDCPRRMTKAAERIASFLPSATEMIYALGLEDRLVGVTHECDFPPAAQEKPIVVRSVLPVETMSQAEIDVAVSARMRNGESLYQVDEALMRYLAPDLIVTQDLCQVCAPSGNEVSKVFHTLDPRPEVLFLTPKSLDGVLDNILAL